MRIFPLVGLLVLASPVFAQFPRAAKWDVREGGRASAIRGPQAEGPIVESILLKKPAPVKSAAELALTNPKLPTVLNDYARLMATAEVSSRWDELYKAKLATLHTGKVLTPHNWFDCETILRLEHPDTGQRVLLIQADMDCVTDGSDPARQASLEDYDGVRESDWYLPETSLSWARTSGRNPFLDYYPSALSRLQKVRNQIAAEAEQDGGVIWREILRSCDDQIYRVKARGLGASTRDGLKRRAFLLSEQDPFIVLPKGWVNGDAAFSPQIGDYAAVIYGGKIYPAVLGDAGPNDKVGEASLRMARAIDPLASGKRRAVNSLGVTYLYFPRSGRAVTPPDLVTWRTKVSLLLDRIGGIGVSLESW